MLSRRLAFVFSALPLVFYVACKDDTAPVGPAGDDGGTNNGFDGGGVDPSVDDAGDLGDSAVVLESCVGNPLTNGNDDGGVAVDPALLSPIARGPFLDGPQWIDEGTGAIVYSEVNAQVVVRNGPDGGARAALRQLGGGDLPIGNAVAGGFIFTALASTPPSATPGTGSILRMQLDGGDPKTFPASPAISPNDLVGSAKGIVYFTDPGFQATTANPITGVYQMTTNGVITPVQQFDGGQNPGARADGIALSQDGTALYVAYFDERRVAKYTVDANGVPSNPQGPGFTPVDSPVAVAVDVGGNIWVAENEPGFLRGRIEVFDPTGKKWGEIPFADSHPTGLAFGGADGKTLYVTTERDLAEGTLYTFPSRCAGVR